MHDAPAAPMAVATGATGESYSYWCLELKNSDTGYTVSACLIHVQHLPSSCYLLDMISRPDPKIGPNPL